MKKEYLKFPSWKQKNYAPKMTGKRFRGLMLGKSIAYKEDGGDPDPADPDAESKAIKAIGEQVTKFTTLLGDKADKAAIETLTAEIQKLQENIKTMEGAEIIKMIDSINTKNEALWKQVVELQEAAAAEKEDGGKGGKKKKGIAFETKDVVAFIKATFDENGKKTHNAAAIQIKAAETMGMATFFEGGEDTDITAFTGRVIDPTLYQRRRKKNFILDNYEIGTINAPTLIFLVKIEDGDDAGSSSGDAGGADWILSSEAKPKRSFRVTTGKAEAKKIAIFGTVEDKLLKDVTSLENWIREDFTQEMREGINDGLLNNDDTVNEKAPQGLKQEAVLFAATAAYDNTISEPNYIDMIFAIRAMFSHNKESLAYVAVSGDVYTRMMHLKDADDRYLNNQLVYVNAFGQLYIGGVRVVEADDEDVPATHVLAVGAEPGFKIKAYGPMVFERGLNGEDFRYDRTSFRGYQEFLTYLPTHRENSIMYDTWENIETAITEA